MSTTAWRALGSALVAFAVLCALAAQRAQAADRTATLPLSAFGFQSGVTITGTNPRFDLYVPDYHSARRLDARFALAFPPSVDADSVVVLRVGDTPIGQSTVGALRKGGVLAASFTRFRGNGHMLDVSVETYLTISGRNCNDYDPRTLWMYVTPASQIAIRHSAAAPASIAEFFEDYDGNFAVNVAPGAPDAIRLAALGLAYWVNQLERWRHVHLTLNAPANAAARTIVVAASNEDLAVRGSVAYANAHGVDLIAARGVSALV